MSEMTEQEALSIVLEVATVRRDQWQALVDNIDATQPIDSEPFSPNDTIQELWECWGEMQEDDNNTEAADLAGMIDLAIQTVAGYMTKTPLAELERIEQILSETIMDEQGRLEDLAESADEDSDDYYLADEWRDNEDGTISAISYAENAAPELDEVRGHVRDACDTLRGMP